MEIIIIVIAIITTGKYGGRVERLVLLRSSQGITDSSLKGCGKAHPGYSQLKVLYQYWSMDTHFREKA